MSKSTLDQAAAKRIQSAEARKNNGKVSKDSFAAKAQSITDKKSSSQKEQSPKPDQINQTASLKNAPRKTDNPSNKSRSNDKPKVNK
ncbi:hypothetical protein [Marinicellulosiphila megalodicopiae]|uniref:hypothetical protein n=1 Tax=Marinicellulosiphila megalodicopiae TaxID=2724896 RepID=UPI003BAF78FB